MEARTPVPTTPDEDRKGTLASMCLALVLVVASVSSVNLALTGISLDLGTTSSQLTWIADGYTVALAALVLPFGALGDRFGRRTLLLVGTVVFGLAALGAAAAQSPGSLIGCRVADGRRRGDDHARHAVHDHRRVPGHKRARAVSVWAGFATSGADPRACSAAGSSSSGAAGGRPSWPPRSLAAVALRRRPGPGARTRPTPTRP